MSFMVQKKKIEPLRKLRFIKREKNLNFLNALNGSKEKNIELLRKIRFIKRT